MFEALKEEIKNLLKEMKESQTKNWEKSANNLKKTKKKK